MKFKLLSIYINQFSVYGIDVFNIDFEDKERSLFCFMWLRGISLVINILFIKLRIEL